MTNHFAFISYASCYGDWVTTFHGHLEAALKLHDPERTVFFDQLDIGSGDAWQNTLQRGVSESEHLILVATPEAFASPWTEAEWQGFTAKNRDRWRAGHFHIVRLVECPLPPFLASLQAVNFLEHNRTKYEAGLRRLLAGLLKLAPRATVPLPPITPPQRPGDAVPAAVRRELVEWLAVQMTVRANRLAFREDFGWEDLEDYPDWQCAASAALVRFVGDGDPVEATARLLAELPKALEGQDPKTLAPLAKLAKKLQPLRQSAPRDDTLERYLDHLAHQEFEVASFLREAGVVELGRVVVPVQLQGVEALATGKGRGEGFRGDLHLEELLALNPLEHPWVTRRWVVQGDPGAGKTTLLRHLEMELGKQGAAAPWVPLLDSLPQMMEARRGPLERVQDRLATLGFEAARLRAVFEGAGRDGRLLILLDGLDEVQRERRGEVKGTIQHLARQWPKASIVVTTRKIGYDGLGAAFREVELRELDPELRREFLGRWFGRSTTAPDMAKAERALELLRGNRALWELSGNPLYLTLLAFLIEKGKLREGRGERSSRTEIYNQVFQLLLKGEHRDPPVPIPNPKVVRKVLHYLAYSMTHDNRYGEPQDDIESRLFQPEAAPLRRELQGLERWRQMHHFLNDLSERTHILGPHDDPKGDWRYWHRTFREALAAERLAAIYRAEGSDAILHLAKKVKGDEGRWAEPYALLTGHLDEPDALVRALVEVNPTLGLRALATAQTLSDETIREVLKLTDKAEERAEVYQQLPELVGDGDRALKLLDRLREGTRNGDDLFFLDLAVRQVAKIWPEQAKAADRLLARFYDHIPAPDDADLFHTINTPLDGPVSLWRKIPTGSFLMGSLKREKDSYDDERPQHEVKITKSFGMGSVPVTNRQYRAFDPGHRWHEWKGVSEAELADHPVVNVSWFAAVSFCRWLSASGMVGARLPTEAEWEYACRAGTQTRYWKGDDESDLAKIGWYDGNSDGRTHRVGEKKANDFGLFDVHGNVWEWTVSPWPSDYSDRKTGIEHDPRQEEGISAADLAASSGEDRVFRGGSYGSAARDARSAFRDGGGPGSRWQNQGFRVVLPVAPEPSPPRSPSPKGRGGSPNLLCP